MQINIAGIVKESVVDGPGIRFVIFAQGCPHHCPGCHNPETHSFDGGEKVDIEVLLKQIKANKLLHGVTFSGGEPFCQAEEFAILGKKVKEDGLNVVTYTGFTYEQLLEDGKARPEYIALLEVTDLLIDGPYLEQQRSLALPFRGSKNQRVIDVPASLRTGEVVLYTKYN